MHAPNSAFAAPMLSAAIANGKTPIGVSAKDLSTGKIHKVNFTDCKYGFAIYQKKPEFGPASIVAKSIEFREVKNEFILDKSSKIELNGAESTGSKKIEIDALFY